MKVNSVLKTAASAAALALSVVGGSSASATTIDFTTQTLGVVTGSIEGVSFAASGGMGGAPNISNLAGYQTLNNGTFESTGYYKYPTASVLDVIFAAPTDTVSFVFSNFGSWNGAFYRALDGSGNVVSNGALDLFEAYNSSQPFSTYYVSGSGISTLEFNNNQGSSSSWAFGISSLSFGPGAPTAPTAPTGPGAPAPLVGGGLLSALAALMALAMTRFGSRAGTFA